MILSFTVKVMDSDFLYLRDNNILDIVWTHQDAIIWLQDINCYYEYKEEFVDQYSEWHLGLSFTIDEHILDFLLLKWPRVFESRATYENVTLIND